MLVASHLGSCVQGKHPIGHSEWSIQWEGDWIPGWLPGTESPFQTWTSVSERLASASPWGLGEPRSNSVGVRKSQKHAFLTSFQAMLILLPQVLRVTGWHYVSNCIDKRKVKLPYLSHCYCILLTPSWSYQNDQEERPVSHDLHGLIWWAGRQLPHEDWAFFPGFYPGLAAAVCHVGSLPII